VSSEEQRQQFVEAIGDCQWVPAPEKAELLLSLAAQDPGQDPVGASPISPTDLAELRAAYGANVDPAVVIWLDSFEPSAEDIWTVLETLVEDELSAELVDAVRRRTKRLGSARSFEVVLPALRNALDAPPSDTFLSAVRFSDDSGMKPAEELIRLFNGADTPEQVATVMRLWRSLAPKKWPVRRRLIDEIYIPLLQRGPSGVEAALEFFDLVSMSRGALRKQISDALLDAARTNKDRLRRVQTRLKKAGWSGRSFKEFWFG
jgi:hypothetical protein